MARGNTYNNRDVLTNLRSVFQKIHDFNTTTVDGLNFIDYFTEKSTDTRYTQEQRDAAKAIASKLKTIRDRRSQAFSRADRISEFLNSNSDYFNMPDSDIDDLIRHFSEDVNETLQLYDSFVLRDNYSEVPNPGSRSWKFLPVISGLKELSLELKEVQAQNGLVNYIENEKELDTSLIYQATLMTQGTKPEDVAEELRDAEKELTRAKNDLRVFKSEQTRNDYKKRFENAHIRLQQIPEQLNAMQEKQDSLKNSISTAETRLNDLPKMKEEYMRHVNTLKGVRQDLIQATDNMNTAIENYNSSIAKINSAPKRLKHAVEDGGYSKEGVKLRWDYAKEKDRQLRWNKVSELSQEMKKQFINDGDEIVITALFGKVGPKLGSNGAVFTEKHLKQFVAGFNPVQKEKYYRGLELKEQILALVPEGEKEAFKELMTNKAGESAKTALMRFPANAMDKAFEADQALSNNKAFLDRRKAQREYDATTKVLNTTLTRLEEAKAIQNPTRGDKQDIETLTETVKILEKELAPSMQMLVDTDTAIITQEVQAVIDMESNKAIAGVKLQEQQEKQEQLERNHEYFSKACTEMRKEIIQWLPEKEIFDSYDAQQRAQGPKERDRNNDLFGKEGQRTLDEMAAEDWAKPEAIFDQVEQTLKKKLDSDREDLEKVSPKRIAELQKEKAQCERDIENYSYSAYRAELHSKHVEAERCEDRAKVLRTMKEHLGVLKEQYNNRVELSHSAVEKVDKIKEDLLARIDEFKANYNKAKKWSGNSNEYTAIETQLNRFTKDTIMDMSPEQMKTALGELAAASRHYIDAKNSQNWYHWFPTSQRVYRKAYADSIVSFAEKQQQAIDMMGISEKAYQQIAEMKKNPLQKITDDAEFAKKVSQLAEPYKENQLVRNYQTFVSRINDDLNQKMTEGEWTQDDERKTWAKKAIAAGAVKKQLWDVRPGQTGLHLDQMKTLYDSELQNAEKRYAKQIDQTVAYAKSNGDLKARNAAYRREINDARANYENIPNYDADIIKQNISQMRKEGKKLNVIV